MSIRVRTKSAQCDFVPNLIDQIGVVAHSVRMNGNTFCEPPKKETRITRHNITLPRVLSEAAEKLFERSGYLGLSDYVQDCLRRDAGLVKVGSSE